MSIPLDRLYHYIESVAQEVYGDVLIYRFYPHGSKNITDLNLMKDYPRLNRSVDPELICNDQEPLNYKLYENIPIPKFSYAHLIDTPCQNLRVQTHGIYDQCLLLHSEQRSSDVATYQNHGFIPVYYWSHALIARDWFRYAEHWKVCPTTDSTLFLIYNRAWSGTREYRLKFLDLLIDYDIHRLCKTTCNFVEPDSKIHYSQHSFINEHFCPVNPLENYFPLTNTNSTASADFDPNDYNSIKIEVVLETLFDDQRIHLTEKILRPIACGVPFIMASAPDALKYLKSYGFKTFDTVFDESYDDIQDPVKRLEKIAQLMKTISQWNPNDSVKKFKQLQQIAEFNKSHFFSSAFSNQIIKELKLNLAAGLEKLETTNTSKKFIDGRKQMSQHPMIRQEMTTEVGGRTRKNLVKILKKARHYYNQHLNK